MRKDYARESLDVVSLMRELHFARALIRTEKTLPTSGAVGQMSGRARSMQLSVRIEK